MAHRLSLCALLLSSHLAVARPGESTLLASPGGYPVPFLVGAQAYATAEAASGGERRILLLARPPGAPAAGPWLAAGVVAADATPGVDLANAQCLSLAADGAIVCAYRHHLPAAGGGMLYRVRATRSADNGSSWAPPVDVLTGSTGLWEPFLYAAPGGAPLRMLVSAELTNGGEQDIVQVASSDGGRTWGPITARVHTPGSRNGMAGVAQLWDGSLLMVLEGFWGRGGWGAFTVNSVRSFDGGESWGQPALLHAPPDGCDAGAPKVGQCGLDQHTNTWRITVVFMTNAPANGSACAPGARAAWPSGAALGVTAGFLDASNTSAPLNMTAAPVGYVPIDAPSALWPAVFMDIMSEGGAADERGSGGPPLERDVLRVAYQAADGAAYLTRGDLCINAVQGAYGGSEGGRAAAGAGTAGRAEARG